MLFIFKYLNINPTPQLLCVIVKELIISIPDILHLINLLIPVCYFTLFNTITLLANSFPVFNYLSNLAP